MVDRDLVRKVNGEILEAIKVIASKHGLDVSLGSCSFSNSNFSTKLEFATINEKGEALSKEREDFLYYAYLHGLQKTDFGKTFTNNGHTFEIIGLKPKSTKYPILCKREDGKVYKFSASTIRLYLQS